MTQPRTYGEFCRNPSETVKLTPGLPICWPQPFSLTQQAVGRFTGRSIATEQLG